MSGNKMRWDCAERGCFNTKKRPKLEVFHDCFARGVNFGDIDMIVESHGQFLLCEWKEGDVPLPRGQALLHEALLRVPQFSIIHVVGDAETMAIRCFTIRHLAWTDRTEGDLSALKARIHSWWLWAESHR